MPARLALLLPIALLAACDKGEPTRVTINAGTNGSVPAEKGSVELGGDGFKANLEIPAGSAWRAHGDGRRSPLPGGKGHQHQHRRQ